MSQYISENKTEELEVWPNGPVEPLNENQPINITPLKSNVFLKVVGGMVLGFLLSGLIVPLALILGILKDGESRLDHQWVSFIPVAGILVGGFLGFLISKKHSKKPENTTSVLSQNSKFSQIHSGWLLLMSVATFFLSPYIFSAEYYLIHGKSFNSGIAGIAFLGLIFPIAGITILTLCAFALIKAVFRNIKSGLELGIFWGTWFIITILSLGFFALISTNY